MQTCYNTCPAGCRGQCLHDIELMSGRDNSDAAFCDFVCQFMNKDDVPALESAPEQPCANFALCGNLTQQWVLNLNGGICHFPCAMTYGRVFEFSNFTADDACPLCLDTGLSSIVFECGHMVCARCYGCAAYSKAATETMKRCPMCRVLCKPRMRDMVDTSFFY